MALHEAVKYVAAVYLLVWLAILVYVLLLHGKVDRLEAELDRIEREFDDRAVGPETVGRPAGPDSVAAPQTRAEAL